MVSDLDWALVAWASSALAPAASASSVRATAAWASSELTLAASESLVPVPAWAAAFPVWARPPVALAQGSAARGPVVAWAVSASAQVGEGLACHRHCRRHRHGDGDDGGDGGGRGGSICGRIP